LPLRRLRASLPGCWPGAFERDRRMSPVRQRKTGLSMTQRERIFAVLESKGFVTNADFQEMGLLHIGRNRISDMDARVHFGAKGLYIHFVKGNGFLDNRWELRKIESAPAFGETTTRLCEQCGHVFQARTRDVKVGLGRFCGLECAWRYGIRKRLGSQENKPASRALQMEMAT
jgi:hypothetical protein